MDPPDHQFRGYVEKLSDGSSKCKFCGHSFAAATSISRIKWHLSGEKGHGVRICEQVPQDVLQEAFLASGDAKKRRKISSNDYEDPIRFGVQRMLMQYESTEPEVADSSNINKATDPASTFPQQNNENADIPMDAWRSTEPETTTSAREQNNEIANSALRGIQAIPTEGCSTEQETEEIIDFSCAKAGNHMENITIERQQPIQTRIHSERFPVPDRETSGVAIQPPDEGQNNLVENGAVQEVQPMEVQPQHKQNVENADMTEAETEDMVAGWMGPADFDRFGIPVEDCYSNANLTVSGIPTGGLVENHFKNLMETPPSIQTSTTPERHPVEEPEIMGSAIPPADELGHNLDENGAVDVEMQQEHQPIEVEMHHEQPLPNIYGKMDINATSTLNAGQIPSGIEGLPREQNNESTNSTLHGIEAIRTEGCSTEPETRENRDISCAHAGNHIKTMTIGMQQPIQTSIHPERFSIHDRETTRAAIQPTYEGQNNLVGNGAVQEFQPMELQEHQPLLDLFRKVDINAKAAIWPLFEKLMSPDLLEFGGKEQVDGELGKWKRNLVKIQADLDVAEVKQATDLGVKYWLSNLRDLAFDAEDILDGLQTEALRSQLKRAESQGCTSTATQGLPTSCADLQPSSVSRDMVTQSKLENITTRLEKLVKEKNDLCLQTNVERWSNRANDRVPTTSLVKEPRLHGREQVKEHLVELLLSVDASNSRHSVIPIVGMGGIGKTTLAQFAYNDGRLKFDHKAWVCVSDEFDITRITQTILLHVGGDPQANDLNVLQQSLKDKLHKKKFLIVLDDIWEHKYDDWTKLCSPFAAGAPGSKIVITTRNTDLSSRIGNTSPFDLKELSYDECLCLFSQHAIDAENFDAHLDLKEVGKKIVKRCKGLPLAAKTLGGLLRHNQQLQKWEEILNSEIWHLSEEESDILPALRLSYHHLPSHLKQCFAYCAIFPKDYEFDKDNLVLLWMAQGFLQQPDRKQPVKYLGSKYFNDLLSRCLFQESSRNKSRYVMHDLLHDLAQFVNGETCFQLDDSVRRSKSCAKVRHSAFIPHRFDTWQRFEVFDAMKSLRTFISLPPSATYGGFYLSSKVLDDLVPKLKCLRSLSLAGYHSLEELPNSILALKHLRYLDLSFTSIKRLPESLGELLNLQTLKLCGCRNLVELPPCIGNLINLECLDVNETYGLQKMPPEISKLKNLVTLPKFIVEEGSGLGIGDLKKLPNLRGQLHIFGLNNIADIHEAKLAKLKEKQGLDELNMEWKDDSHGAQNESQKYQVLNSLQPHQSLRKLSVTFYGGTTFPSWVGDPIFTKLVDLQLRNCRRITSLPPLGKLPALRNLRLEGMDKVKEVAAEGFPSLETLIIKAMRGWEQWSWPNGLNEKFPKLHTLTLANCHKLVGNWSISLPSLRQLDIFRCPLIAEVSEALPSLCELKVGSEVISKSMHRFTSLTNLTIYGFRKHPKGFVRALDGNALGKLANLKTLNVRCCNQLVSLVEGEEGRLPGNLQVLRISCCKNLEKLPMGLYSHTSLRELEISYCPRLVSFPEEEGWLPGNLQVLIISTCENLEKLPMGLYSHTSLRELEIEGCPRLVSFPERAGLPCGLKSLKINCCESLESLPHGMTTTTMNGNKNQQCLLEEIIIWDCPSLKYFPTERGGMLPTTLKRLDIYACDKLEFPEFEFPTTLEALEIGNCKMLKSLPSSQHILSHLTELRILGCYELELFPEDGLPLPNLIEFYIEDCKKLRCLPNHMENLTSLQHLDIGRCPSLESFPDWGFPPNLIELFIYKCEKLTRRLMSRDSGLHALTSLKSLSLSSTGGDVDDYFRDEGGPLLPTSLTDLDISCHTDLKSISGGIQHLTSLEKLSILRCPNLNSLPKEGFPPTLGCLVICNCPLLKEGCLKEKGDYWPVVAHIPEVKIS